MYGGPDEKPAAGKVVDDPAWPALWPRTPGGGETVGVIALTYVVRARVIRRKVEIRRDRLPAGARYPRETVRRALAEFDVVL